MINTSELTWYQQQGWLLWIQKMSSYIKQTLPTSHLLPSTPSPTLSLFTPSLVRIPFTHSCLPPWLDWKVPRGRTTSALVTTVCPGPGSLDTERVSVDQSRGREEWKGAEHGSTLKSKASSKSLHFQQQYHPRISNTENKLQASLPWIRMTTQIDNIIILTLEMRKPGWESLSYLPNALRTISFWRSATFCFLKINTSAYVLCLELELEKYPSLCSKQNHWGKRFGRKAGSNIWLPSPDSSTNTHLVFRFSSNMYLLPHNPGWFSSALFSLWPASLVTKTFARPEALGQQVALTVMGTAASAASSLWMTQVPWHLTVRADSRQNLIHQAERRPGLWPQLIKHLPTDWVQLDEGTNKEK